MALFVRTVATVARRRMKVNQQSFAAKGQVDT